MYNSLREYLPLEQGLRQDDWTLELTNDVLREYLPLEQGLRPADCLSHQLQKLSETIFHYNKD